MKTQALFFLFISILLVFSSCQDDIVYTPKPRGFPKIDLPSKSYQAFDKDYCTFTFEYPSYAEVFQDTLFFGERSKNPCWFDLRIKELNASIHCTYLEINAVDTYDKLVNDAFSLTNEHNKRADYIETIAIRKPNKVYGNVFNVDGAVASPFQFYLTDSTTHFMRGALYINDKVQPDSLAPIYEFLKADMMHLVNTFEWNKGGKQ